MNRYISVLILVFLICIAPVSANTRLELQDATDLDFITTSRSSGGVPTWTGSNNGGNKNIICIVYGFSTDCAIRNRYPVQMDYFAVTYSGASGFYGFPYMWLYDNANNVMVSIQLPDSSNTRIEMKMIGGSAYIYKNGVEDQHTVALSQNPSYVEIGNLHTGGWGGYSHTVTMDDLIWGSDGSKYTFGMPAENEFYIKKDLLNPSASGFYFANGTLISSFLFYTTYSKATGDNETIGFENYADTVSYQTQYTGSLYSATKTWNITAFLERNPPYGLYQAIIRPQSPATPFVGGSSLLAYISGGATVTWDREKYSANDVATISYVISPAYFVPATYTYTGKILDIYGTEYKSEPITSATGSFTSTLDAEEYDPGYYFAEIIATPTAGGSGIVMNYDTAEIVNYLTIVGYVLDAATGSPLTKANITITQSSLVSRLTSGYDGNYTTVGTTFYPDYALWVNTSAISFDSDNHTWRPLIAKTYNLNISMIRNYPYPTSNVTIGGIIYEMPYYTPLANANGVAINTSYGSCTATTNLAGFYRCGNLEVNKYYDVWGWMTGYVNSTVYSRFVTGV